MSLEKEFIKELYGVLQGKTDPKSCQLEIILQRMRFTGALPDNERTQQKISSFIFFILTFNLGSIIYFIITTKDVIAALDSSLILMGFLLIASKHHDFRQNSSEIRALCAKVICHYKKIEIHPEMPLAMQLFCALTLQAIIHWGDALPFPARYPGLDLTSMTTFSVLMIFQCTMIAHNLFMIVMMGSTIICIFFYMFIFFELLQHKTKELDKPWVDDDEARKILRNIVEEHQTLIGIIKATNKTFDGSLAAQLVASFTMLGFSGFMAAVTTSSPMLCFKFTAYFVAVFWQTVFWCVNGHQPYSASECLGDALVETNWLDRSVKYRKDFLFVIQRCQTPSYFCASNIGIFNYRTLLMICRKSYTSFALLRTMVTDIKFN